MHYKMRNVQKIEGWVLQIRVGGKRKQWIELYTLRKFKFLNFYVVAVEETRRQRTTSQMSDGSNIVTEYRKS